MIDLWWLDISLCPPLETVSSAYLTEGRLDKRLIPVAVPVCSRWGLLASLHLAVCLPAEIPSMSVCPHSAHSWESVSLSPVHWSIRRNERPAWLSCQVGRLLARCSHGQPSRGFLSSGRAAAGMLSRSNTAWSWVVGAQVYLKWSVVHR